MTFSNMTVNVVIYAKLSAPLTLGITPFSINYINHNKTLFNDTQHNNNQDTGIQNTDTK